MKFVFACIVILYALSIVKSYIGGNQVRDLQLRGLDATPVVQIYTHSDPEVKADLQIKAEGSF